MIEWSKAVHRKNMCVRLANGKVFYICSVAFATYILKGRFSDTDADLTKSGTFHNIGISERCSACVGRGLLFHILILGFTRACQAEFEQGTLFFVCQHEATGAAEKQGE